MAEGGLPEEPSKYDLSGERIQVTDSLEMLFSRDILHHVLRRRMPGWTFEFEFGVVCPCTPFSFRVREAVDFYLNRESISLFFLFAMAFMDQTLDYDGFVEAVNFAVRSSFPQMTESNEVLRLLCLYSIYAARACKLGVGLAPYYAVVHIGKLLETFIRRKNTTAEIFFGRLGYEAENLIHEDCRIQFFDNP